MRKAFAFQILYLYLINAFCSVSGNNIVFKDNDIQTNARAIARQEKDSSEEYPAILGLELVSADSRKHIRSITGFDVISEVSPWTIVAKTTGGHLLKNVTYVKPFLNIVSKAPYPALGFRSETEYHPITLKRGKYTVSAHVNNEKWYEYVIPIFYDSNLPNIGPSSLKLPPTTSNGQTLAEIPNNLGKCDRKNGPSIEIVRSGIYYESYETIEVYSQVDWCSKSSVRSRLLQFKTIDGVNVTNLVETRVLQEYESKGDEIVKFFVGRECNPYLVYLEVCSKDKKEKPLCGTTHLKRIPRLPVPEPRLKFRPPIVLFLAPGDSIQIETVTVKVNHDISSETEGFSNGGHDFHGYKLKLKSIVEREDGKKTSTGWSSHLQSILKLDSISKKYNNSEAYIQYRSPKCKKAIQSWRKRYATKIFVDENTPSLVKQDFRLPDFSTPGIPQPELGETISIRIEAVNNGGGRRADGSPTELHYQWYIRREDMYYSKETYAEPIAGETRNVIDFKVDRCYSTICGLWECSNLGILYVDVCNTYGCRRSDGISIYTSC